MSQLPMHIPERWETADQFEAACRVLKIERSLIDFERNRRHYENVRRMAEADAEALQERLDADAAARIEKPDYEPLPDHRRAHIEARRDECQTKAEHSQELIWHHEKLISTYRAALREG